MFVHTDLAHKAIDGSVRASAAIASRALGRSTRTSVLAVRDLFTQPPAAFATEVARRMEDLTCGEPAVLVIEHITSMDGLRLPIALIHQALRAVPNVEVIIDGAQAVGLWPPECEPPAKYIGCFHKYAAAPAGTGFCVLDPLDIDTLPYHVRVGTLKGLSHVGDCWPTIDTAKWIECADVLMQRMPVSQVGERQIVIQGLRAVLMCTLRDHLATTFPDALPEYRSHIVTVQLASEECARTTSDALAREGVAVKCIEDTVRLTLHHTLDTALFAEIAEMLSRIARGPALRAESKGSSF